ncbi:MULTISPECIES: hypothetical protein [unclassified Bradyrhizobium]|uniref:hypothetical protein n=1 Tax=unclassified Bradyrhizobium TaxID=2631580 RepID=UPI0029169EBA|nr:MULTISPECIES: hypothetical protein [unclassified Bradyrhizobium]
MIDDIERRAAAYKEHGSERKAARVLGISKTAMHESLKRAAERGLLGFKPVLPGYELKRSSAQLDDKGNVQKEWVTQHKESGPVYQMPAGQVLKGTSAFVDAEGRIRHQWIKTKADSVAPDLIEAIKAEFAAYDGRAPVIRKPAATERDLLNVLAIADPHVGMLSWGEQTGADYDLNIARKRVLGTSADVISAAPRARELLIANLGDWYHANDQRNVTPKSKHQLDVDGRWFKVLRTGVRLFIDIIEVGLRRHDLVEVVNIPGNHDPEAAAALALALSCFYSRNRRVKIAFPSDIYYRQFGATLLGCAHGDKAPPSRMAMAMAVDQREAWGRTAYHWFLYGHIHNDKVDTHGDVKVEAFSTIADKDSHAFGGAWRSAQSLQLITLHKRLGPHGRVIRNIPPPSMRAAA